MNYIFNSDFPLCANVSVQVFLLYFFCSGFIYDSPVCFQDRILQTIVTVVIFHVISLILDINRGDPSLFHSSLVQTPNIPNLK